MADKDNDMESRRGFMKKGIAAIGSLIAIGYGVPGVAYVVGPTLQEKIEKWIPLGSADKVPPGEPKLFKATVERKSGWIVDTQEYAVYVSTDDGQNFGAMSNVCTHLGCRVRWIEDRQIFYCPCHNAQFDKNGEVLDGPPPRPLDQVEVKVEDGQIYMLGG